MQDLALASGREVMLLVEDDEQVLSLTGQTLRDLGYEVIEAPKRCGGVGSARRASGGQSSFHRCRHA